MKTSKTPEPAIPVVDFYGEARPWPIHDQVHCEGLSLRSGEHDWHIKSHRHANLLQIFYVSKGSGKALVDADQFVLGDGDILIIPPMSVHSLAWSPGAEGQVLLLASPLAQRLATDMESRPWTRADRLLFNTSSDGGFIDQTLGFLAVEYSNHHLHRAVMLECLVRALMVWLERQRQLDIRKHQRASKPEEKCNRFLDLIEKNYHRHHDVSWYAGQLGITSPRLSTISRELKDKTALELIHGRILLEAQRLLLYTGKTAVEIAEALGFSDPAYFNRFFKRLSGATPGKFKAKSCQF